MSFQICIEQYHVSVGIVCSVWPATLNVEDVWKDVTTSAQGFEIHRGGAKFEFKNNSSATAGEDNAVVSSVS